MNKTKHSGFTLIELVVVITILGILAAFAVPRFTAIEGKAREAAVLGLAGSVRSAAALAHSMQLVSGLTPNASVTIDGQTIRMSNGYPTRADIAKTLTDTSGFTYAAGTGVFSKTGAPVAASCAATYIPATATAAAVVTTPQPFPAGAC